MSLFNENSPLSEEASALYDARTLLAATSALQELLECAGDATTCKALIVPGPNLPPLDGQTYTVSELTNRLAWAQIHPMTDEDSLLITRSKAVGCPSEKDGFFRVHVRRQVRAAEYNADAGRRDVYMFFLDRTSRMCEQFVEAADLNLAAHQIKRRKGPQFNPKADQKSQGIFIWADFLIAWGGSEHAE